VAQPPELQPSDLPAPCRGAGDLVNAIPAALPHTNFPSASGATRLYFLVTLLANLAVAEHRNLTVYATLLAFHITASLQISGASVR